MAWEPSFREFKALVDVVDRFAKVADKDDDEATTLVREFKTAELELKQAISRLETSHTETINDLNKSKGSGLIDISLALNTES